MIKAYSLPNLERIYPGDRIEIESQKFRLTAHTHGLPEDAYPESGDAHTDGNRLETLKWARMVPDTISCHIWQLGPPK